MGSGLWKGRFKIDLLTNLIKEISECIRCNNIFRRNTVISSTLSHSDKGGGPVENLVYSRMNSAHDRFPTPMDQPPTKTQETAL